MIVKEPENKTTKQNGSYPEDTDLTSVADRRVGYLCHLPTASIVYLKDRKPFLLKSSNNNQADFLDLIKQVPELEREYTMVPQIDFYPAFSDECLNSRQGIPGTKFNFRCGTSNEYCFMLHKNSFLK